MIVPLFRISAILEGISFLLLFAVGMPLKYWGAIPQPNTYIGYVHGFLFLAYVALAIVVTMERSWGMKRFALLFAASLLPFGTFYLDEHYLKKLAS